MKRPRSRRRRQRPHLGRALWLAVVVLGALAGGWAAPWILAHLSSPVALDPATWSVIVPGQEEGMAGSTPTDGTGLVDGTLVLSTRSFGRRDVLMLQDPRPVGALTIDLAPWSGPLAVTVRTAGGAVLRPIFLAPGGWCTPGEDTLHPSDGPVRVVLSNGWAWVDGKHINPGDPGVLELSAVGGEQGTQGVAIRSIRYEAPDGTVLLDQAFGPPPRSLATRSLVGLAAGLLTAAGWALVAASPALGGLLLLALLLLPLAVLVTPFSEWRQLCMQLYLVDTPAAAVRQLALAVAVAPIGMAGLLASGLLGGVGRQRGLPLGPVAAVVVAAGLLASRELSGAGWLLAPLGLVLLALPYWTARRASQPLGGVLVRDLPALGSVAVATWGPGLLQALVWRLLCLTADAAWFNRRHPRAGADAFVLTLLALPLGAEVMLRSTPLPDAWARAHTEAVERDGDFSVFWQDRCGDGPVQNVYFMGGSSVGGAYQFQESPEAFFAARTHAGLCAARPDRALRTLNYGQGGRDSLDFAQAAPVLYADAPPAVVVLYLGVNDLLTIDHPLTRKQRAARTDGARRGSSLALVNALALLVRPSWADQDPVVAIPIEDAAENLAAIAAATRAAGGHLLLVPEQTRAAIDPIMAPYQALERELAESLEGVSYLDLDAVVAALPEDVLLADRNHLTHAGSERVAGVLVAEIGGLLAR